MERSSATFTSCGRTSELQKLRLRLAQQSERRSPVSRARRDLLSHLISEANMKSRCWPHVKGGCRYYANGSARGVACYWRGLSLWFTAMRKMIDAHSGSLDVNLCERCLHRWTAVICVVKIVNGLYANIIVFLKTIFTHPRQSWNICSVQAGISVLWFI